MKSKEDFTETVKILINYGADVNARNARGETAMHLAARNEFQKVIEVLVLAGCDPATEDNDKNQAVDLTSDGDSVSLQILRHAAAERDRYMSESMEIRARGFTTLTQSQAALPLCVRSPSLLSVPVLMGAAGSAQNITRAASSPGLFASPPHSTMLPGHLGSGYLAANGFLSPGVVMAQNGSQQLLNKSQGGAGLSTVETCAPDELYSNIAPAQYQVNSGSVSAYRGSGLTQITAPSDNDYRLSTNTFATPSVPVYNSVGDKSSVWNVSLSSSVKNHSDGRPDSEYKKEVPEHRKRKIIKKKADSSVPPAAAKKITVPNAQLTVHRVPLSEPLPDENDTYFDDESFDTFVETTFSEEDLIAPPPPLPPRCRSSQASSVGADSSLQRWLDEQDSWIQTNRGITSDTRSFSSTTVTRSNAPPAIPPKPTWLSSSDASRRRPPPPVPAEKSKSRGKASKSRLAPVKNVVDVDSEDWIAQQARRNQHWEDEADDQHNTDVRKSSRRKIKKKKKKNTDVSKQQNGDTYRNIDDSMRSPPVDSPTSPSWAAGNTVVSEQKSPQPLQATLPQLPVGRPSQPLVFEKVTIKDDQIANDYLFHKSIAELTAASAENIVECVGRKMSNESSPGAHSSPAANTVMITPSVGYSPQSVFQYPASASSFSGPQNFVQHPAGNRSQVIFSGLLPAEPQHQMHVRTEDDLPYQRPLPNQPPALPSESSRPDSMHSQVSQVTPDEQSSLYDTLDDEKFNKHDSGVSDDLMPPYGLNRRTVVLKSDGKVGISVCGGNVSGTFVRTVAAHSAAAAAGLAVGDWIVAVNGKVVKSFTKQEVRQLIEKSASESVRLVIDRDDDRFKLAAMKNAVGDSFYVRSHYSYSPIGVARGKELPVKVGDVFQVTDSLPVDAVGYWVAKKVSETVGEPEGLIPNGHRAEQIITKQRLTSPTLNRPRGGAFMRSFRRSKYSDQSSDQDSLDSRQSSECGDIVPYVRVVEHPSSVRRPVVVMGLFCDTVCAMLQRDSPATFQIPKTPIEQRRASAEEFTPSMLDISTIRTIGNSGVHCLMIVSPRAVQFLREKTELQPIVVYMSPSSKSVLKTMMQGLAPDCNKKPGFLLEESVKFERFHTGLFDAVVPYKSDNSWLDLLKDTIGRLQRHRIWIPFEPEDSFVANSSPPDLIRTTGSCRNEDHRLSKTTDDIPDQIQDLLFRHINVVSPMISSVPTDGTNDLCMRSFDLGDQEPVLEKPPKAVSGQHNDVVLRKPRTKGRPLVNKAYMVSKFVCNYDNFFAT